MKQHILLELANCYSEPQQIIVPENCVFSHKSGYWKNISTGEIMMLSDNPCKPQTKKEDIETGEDQKGE